MSAATQIDDWAELDLPEATPQEEEALDDFSDLDELLVESEALAAQRKRKSRESSGQWAAYSLGSDTLNSWDTIGTVATCEHVVCSCGSTAETFCGYYSVQFHRRDLSARKLTAVPAPLPGLPVYRFTNIVETDCCPRCMIEHEAPADVVAEWGLEAFGNRDCDCDDQLTLDLDSEAQAEEGGGDDE